MKNLLALALVLALAVSACERVEEERSSVLPPSPEVAGKVPPAKQPPEGPVVETQPQVPAPTEQKAPEGKAPEVTPALSARDLLLLDMEVASSNILAARTDLGAEKPEPAKAKVEAALRSLAYIEVSLPSSRALELAQRCLVQISQGQTQQAIATLQDVSSVLPQVGGLSKPQEAAKLVTEASASLSKGNAEAANKSLQSLQATIQGGEQEALLARLKDHVRGAQYAIYRNAIAVAGVELDEANKYLGQLRSLTEAAWTPAKA